MPRARPAGSAQPMFATYFPVFVLTGVATLVAALLFTITSLAGPKNLTPEKAIPYESGSETQGARHVRLSVKFYLTAILFVVFDIEAVFLYPWGGLFRDLIAPGALGGWGIVEMAAFITILALTLVYAWKKGALEWEN